MASHERFKTPEFEEEVKPLLRGVSHALAFGAALAGFYYLARAPVQGLRHWACVVFGASLVLMFGVSGTYHCPTWSPATYCRLQRCDHAAIYFLIAGSFTPMAAMDAEGWGPLTLGVMWAAALTGAGLALGGYSGPRGLRSVVYFVLGTVSVPVVVRLPAIIGPERVAWLVFGASLYAVGAVIYARKWLDFRATFFGYHEVFHLLVIAAASVHYAVVVDVMWNGG